MNTITYINFNSLEGNELDEDFKKELKKHKDGFIGKILFV